MRILQLSETAIDGDGMGNHIVLTHLALQEAGIPVNTFVVNRIRATTKIKVQQATMSMKVHADDIVFYHYGIDGEAADIVESLECKKILVYHNITPPSFFAPYNHEITQLLENGYQRLRKWAMEECYDAMLVMSEHNKYDLIAAGYPRDQIFMATYLIPFDEYAIKSSAKKIQQYTDGMTNILFVGRISPNKKQEDVIRAFAEYQNTYNPNSRLIFVGGGAGGASGKYWDLLDFYQKKLEVKNVVYESDLKFAEIVAMYNVADVFVCMSEHEGFCIPLVEAMHFEVPVIAYAAAAVPDTMDGAGVVLESKSPRLVAMWMDQLITNTAIRKEIVEKQNQVIEKYDLKCAKQEMILRIKELMQISRDQNHAWNAIRTDMQANLSGNLYDIVTANMKTGKKLPFTKALYSYFVHAIPTEIHLDLLDHSSREAIFETTYFSFFDRLPPEGLALELFKDAEKKKLQSLLVEQFEKNEERRLKPKPYYRKENDAK